MRVLKILAFALIVALLASPALATAETAKSPVAAKREMQRSYLSSAELDEIEALQGDERAAFLKKKREEFQALSPIEAQKILKERAAAFAALPAAEQQTIKERTERLIIIADTPPPARDVAAEERHAQQQAEDFVKNLPPEQRAQWEEIRRNSKLWQEKQPGKK